MSSIVSHRTPPGSPGQRHMSPVDTPPASPKSASSSKSGSMSGSFKTHPILVAPAHDLPPPAVSRGRGMEINNDKIVSHRTPPGSPGRRHMSPVDTPPASPKSASSSKSGSFKTHPILAAHDLPPPAVSRGRGMESNNDKSCRNGTATVQNLGRGLTKALSHSLPNTLGKRKVRGEGGVSVNSKRPRILSSKEVRYDWVKVVCIGALALAALYIGFYPC